MLLVDSVKAPGWAVIEAERNHDVLVEILDNLGNRITAHVVPESLCHDLRDKLQSLLGLSRDALTPRPGGLFPELFEGLTLVAQDPDVHVHEWLRGKVPLGITTHIPLGGIFRGATTSG